MGLGLWDFLGTASLRRLAGSLPTLHAALAPQFTPAQQQGASAGEGT